MPKPSDRLRSVRSFKDLLPYLEEKLGWPLEKYGFDELTYSYDPSELGLKDEFAAQIKKIYQLRPLDSSQPWGIFFVEFEKKKLPVVVLRNILSHLVVKKRAEPNRAESKRWSPEDLLFISTYDAEDSDQREIAFAHFHQVADDLPTLRVLGWDGADTPLKLDHVDATLREQMQWPGDPQNHEAWRSSWRRAFRHRIGHTIQTADKLAEVLASLARAIRDKAKTKLAAESDRGPLRKLFKAFQVSLIHDLTEEGFADTYAQTITYGLLTAAISRTEMSEGRHGTALIADNVADIVPVTNPFLKEMLQTFLKVGGRKGGIDFDELGIQDVVELLRGEETDLPAILRDFGNRTRGEDPVIHFYEHFLSAYNKKLKIQRGVFYTPQPVVSYIVRSVHELLQKEFELEDGLASTVTWGAMLKKFSSNGEFKIPEGTSPETMFVQILDPATGTATFLVEALEVIHRHLSSKWDKGGFKAMPSLPPSSFSRLPSSFSEYWNQYVPLALLPRLHGYELMMAPYAIAHMKIGLKLFETGYRFGSDERARIYLTNALEPWEKQLRLSDFEALAHEAAAVNEIKRNTRFTVVIGNPPYSYMSANLTEAAATLIEPFRYVDGHKIKERSALSLERSLQDDFVKFFGLALHLRRDTNSAFVLGFITNNSYMDSALHRGVRGELMHLLNRIYLVNLFGDSIKDREGNVFDIQQGVAIFFGAKLCKSKAPATFTAGIHGNREDKCGALQQQSWSTTDFVKIQPLPPQRYFLRLENGGEYPYLPSLMDIFQLTSTCIKTLKDDMTTGFEKKQVRENIEFFRNPQTSKKDIKARFGVEDVVQWKVEPARRTIQSVELGNFLAQYQARPFDYRWMFYHNAVIGSPRTEVMRNLVKGSNLALIANRKIRTGDCHHFWVTSQICVSEIISSADNSNCFPLYIVADENGLQLGKDFQPNFTDNFLNQLSNSLGLTHEKVRGLPTGLAPETVFRYAYAVFHSPTYRTRYAEFLKIDFPRLPLTGNLVLFRTLAEFGEELIALHLMESPKLDKFKTEFVGGKNPIVEKVSWSDRTVWIDKAKTTGFKGVPENVWNFHIGGYQVCEKWLKDRKGRTLSKEDIAHYQKIVVALSETIRLMKEIDGVIEKHGGWPGAFVTNQTPEVATHPTEKPSRPVFGAPRPEQVELPLAAEPRKEFGKNG